MRLLALMNRSHDLEELADSARMPRLLIAILAKKTP